MNFDENATKIVLGIISLLLLIAGGALITIKKTKKRSSRNTISNVEIKGNKNKIIGGDDKSVVNDWKENIGKDWYRWQ